MQNAPWRVYLREKLIFLTSSKLLPLFIFKPLTQTTLVNRNILQAQFLEIWEFDAVDG